MKSEERGEMGYEQSAKMVKCKIKENKMQHSRFVHEVKPKGNAYGTASGGTGISVAEMHKRASG